MKKIITLLICYFLSFQIEAQNNYDLYSAGRIGTGTFAGDTACYWKNNIQHKLYPSKSRVSALYIDGKDVYISGHFLKNNRSQPCYWKNGNLIELENNGEAYTNDIFVLGVDVYVIGNQKLTTKGSIPCYWKNGVKKDLDVPEKMSGYVKAISGFGKDFYIVGFLTSASEVIENKFEACYWKNGKLTHLNPSPYTYSIASKVNIDKGIIYIAGRLDDTKNECLSIWQDFTRMDYLTTPNRYLGKSFIITWESADYIAFSYEKGLARHKISINSMRVLNGNIYVVGKQHKTACYWLNGDIIELSEIDKNINLIDITIIDKKLIIAGTYEKSICIWENGVKREIVKLYNNEVATKFGFMKN
ncbi:MAG: hypothetical protein JKY16_01865 [Lutibacter sp.]|nr:hypothetical protein [Lutibacter sp.]